MVLEGFHRGPRWCCRLFVGNRRCGSWLARTTCMGRGGGLRFLSPTTLLQSSATEAAIIDRATVLLVRITNVLPKTTSQELRRTSVKVQAKLLIMECLFC